MPGEKERARVIYVMGIDGSGKSTVVSWIAEQFRARGFRVSELWLRFNHVLTKPLLGYCRLAGLTRYETVHGHRIGYHEFHRSRLVSGLFIALQYLDAARVRLLRVSPRLGGTKGVVVLDRYVYDILIDIMVATRKPHLHGTAVGSAFKRLLPKHTRVFYVERPRDALLAVRPDSEFDRNFDLRLRLYGEVARAHRVEILENRGSLEELFQQVAGKIGLCS